MNWEPITRAEIIEEISKGELCLGGEELLFWNKVKIIPEKWGEKDRGMKGNGFWVVGLLNDQYALWYNDLEDGFNIIEFERYGEITEYSCDKDEFDIALIKLLRIRKSGVYNNSRLGPPEKL